MQAVPRFIAGRWVALLTGLLSISFSGSARAWIAIAEPGVELKAVACSLRGVAVAGRRFDSAGNAALFVAQYSPSGTPLWRVTETGLPSSAGQALAVAADTRGDVYVAGAAPASSADGNFIVAKYAAASGKQLWLTAVSQAQGLGEALALDRTGHVLAAGYASLEDGPHGMVAQLDGTTGKLRWQWSPLAGELRAVALDSRGDVFSAGRLLAVKLSGASGDEMWRVDRSASTPPELGAPVIRSLAVDAGGNLVAGGALRNSLEETRAFYTAVLDGATGAIRWESLGPASATPEGVAKVAVDPNGSVYAAGQYQALPAVQRLDRVGNLDWLRNPWPAGDRSENSLAVNDLAVDARAVYAAGSDGKGRFLLTAYTRAGKLRWQRDLGAGKAVAETLCANGRLFAVGQLFPVTGDLPRAVVAGFTASTGASLPTGKK